MFRRVCISVVMGLGLVALLLQPVGAAVPASEINESCPTPETVGSAEVLSAAEADGVNALACDLVGVILTADGSSGGVTVQVPPPGEAVSADAFMDGDGADSLFAETDSSGEVDTAEMAEPVPVEPPGPCVDPQFNQLFARNQVGADYHFNRNSFPNNLNESRVVGQIGYGMSAWTRLNSDCANIDDDIQTDVASGGHSTAGTSIVNLSTGPDCQIAGNDGFSQIEFGTLPASTWGVTCRHYINTQYGLRVDGSDIRLNHLKPWTLDGDDPACSGKDDLLSIITHEAGHWWGLAHVNWQYHGRLTMRNGGAGAQQIVRCNTMLRTLGKGDALGMRSFYG